MLDVLVLVLVLVLLYNGHHSLQGKVSTPLSTMFGLTCIESTLLIENKIIYRVTKFPLFLISNTLYLIFSAKILMNTTGNKHHEKIILTSQESVNCSIHVCIINIYKTKLNY